MALRVAGLTSAAVTAALGYTPANQNGTNTATNVAAPTTGQTVTVAQSTNLQVADPAGVLAALTVQFPVPLADGHCFGLSVTQSITALTLTPNSGASIKGNFTSVTTYLATKYRYNAANTTWYECV